MKQLSGTDAAFVYAEDGRQPQHVGNLCIYDPSTAPNGAATYEATVNQIRARVHLAPLMRQKLLTVPFNADHPYWLQVADFDSTYHLHSLALPAPGGWEQLCSQVSLLHEGQLDRSQPLWQTYLIEGLHGIEGIPEGAIACYSKIHHAAMDGIAAVELGNATHDLTPEGDTKPPPGPWAEDRVLAPWELLGRAQFNNAMQPIRFADFLRRSADDWRNTFMRVTNGELKAPEPAPRTRFNANISSTRVFDGISTSLDGLRAIKSSVPGATINDVVLTLCGGALRKYLRNKGELPDSSLLAAAPISIRSKEQSGAAGNQISDMTVSMCTHIEGALARLKAVTEDTHRAKDLIGTMGARNVSEYRQFAPAAFVAASMRLSSQLGLAGMAQPPFNCIVTNVPGSPLPLYSIGSKMVQSWGLGPLVDGCGLFHTVGSYCGEITISATSCREMMPDPDVYMDGMRESLDELTRATRARKPRVSVPRKPPRQAPRQPKSKPGAKDSARGS